MKKYRTKLEKVLERHRNFWKRSPTDRPLIGIPWFGGKDLEPSIGLPPGIITPEQLNPDRFVAAYEQSYKENGLFEGDFFKVASALYFPRTKINKELCFVGVPPFFIPWVEAIFGCEVEAKPSGLWAKAHEEGKEKPIKVECVERNPWLKKVLEITEVLNKAFAASYPTAPPMLRGPADMVAALLGTERMCIDIIKEPEKVQELLQMATNVWLTVNSYLQKIAIKFQAGYSLPRFQLWAPEHVIATQEDCSIFFSPDRYNKFLYGVNKCVLASYPYTIMHIHSSGRHVTDYLLSIKEMAALEIVIDETGPTPLDIMSSLAEIQKEKPLILHRQFTKEELLAVFENLSPEGLCINAVPGSSEAAIKLLQNMVDEHN